MRLKFKEIEDASMENQLKNKDKPKNLSVEEKKTKSEPYSFDDGL